MRLSEYLEDKARGEIARISRESGVSYVTVHGCANGELLNKYDVAKRISDATGGAVSVAELCEEPKPVADASAPKRAAGSRR